MIYKYDVAIEDTLELKVVVYATGSNLGRDRNVMCKIDKENVDFKTHVQ